MTVAGRAAWGLPVGTGRSILQAGLSGGQHDHPYGVIVERAEDGGCGAWCPDLAGCAALGDAGSRGLVTHMTGAMVCWGIGLGDELGLYRALADAGPCTAQAVAAAAAAGMNPRLVRE